MSDFDKGCIVEQRDCGLSYRSIAARVCRDRITVSRIWNRRVQDGNMEHHAGSQRPFITSSREDREIQVLFTASRWSHFRVWQHCNERIFAACIRYRHTGPSSGVMIWVNTGYSSQ
ncbi:uncharacterized protein TNCV_821321 [Trichonephila clavipes]|nr:uncharacterized protein TNCV_821321 [Trichonephila clavipes]